MKQISVGLIPAPELPETVANKLIGTLERAFSMEIDDNIYWKVDVIRDQLTGASGIGNEIIERAVTLKKEHSWHYAVCLTDIPVFSDKQVVVAEDDDQHGVAQISIPALGAFPLKTRVKKAIIQMVGELYYRVNGAATSANNITDRNNKKFLRSGFTLSPIRKVFPNEENTGVRFIVTPRVHGIFRLLAGMTYANRPWTIIPSFKRVVAVAFATGAYGLVFTTLWSISAAYGYLRFIVLMLVAMAAMVTWIIFAHNLWEKNSRRTSRKLTILFNMVTVTTLTTAVIAYYILLYVLFLMAVAFFVPPDLFASTVGLGEEVTFGHYFQLAWLVTSVATVAGALGSGLEDDKAVRKIMYGDRQSQRYKEEDGSMANEEANKNLSFQLIKAKAAPDSVREWIQQNQSEKQNNVFHENGKTYVVILLGQKTTGGYKVEIEKIRHIEADIGEISNNVVYSVTEPQKGSVNIQVLTYPMALAVLDSNVKGTFQFEQMNEGK